MCSSESGLMTGSIIDFDQLVKQLMKIKYEGWCVVEAEQDPELAPPFEFIDPALLLKLFF